MGSDRPARGICDCHNSDHKWTFTVHKPQRWSPRSLNVLDLLTELSHLVEIERIVLLRDFFRDELPAELDQTMTPVAECGIEVIVRKRAEPLRPRSQRFK